MYLIQDPKTGYYTDVSDSPTGKKLAVFSAHSPSNCVGDHPCAIHNTASDHPLSEAPLYWRQDIGVLERICGHGVGHPDFDSIQYLASVGQDTGSSHGCDGCCALLNPTRTCPSCKQEDLGIDEDYCIHCFIKDVSIGFNNE